METPNQIKNRIHFKLRKFDYKGLKKAFQLMTVLFIVGGAYDTYLYGITLTSFTSFVIASLMFNFANKCETMILHKKINKWLASQEIKVEE